MRRIPILPTLIVALAVGIMIWLGVWQLHRLQWKEALLARYTQAQASSAEVAWPRDPADVTGALFHHSRFTCVEVLGRTAISGRNRKAEPGWAQTARCRVIDDSGGGGGEALVVLGWSRDPGEAAWAGGEVRGVIASAGGNSARLIADPPVAGLQASATPDPRDIPNNHLAYAVQWFLFAATATIIYAIAVRKRLKP
nr:SURF1 family protein [Novosphingobium lentum]